MMSIGQPEVDHGSNTAVTMQYLTNAVSPRESSEIQLSDLKESGGGGLQVGTKTFEPVSGTFFSEVSICMHICPIFSAAHIKLKCSHRYSNKASS